ncbi:MAG: hypothetical protein AAF561_01640 [Planctomycetota bacterium]
MTTSRMTALVLAFYVAVSWTWVIGMMLPVLLVRDFGIAGWILFAIPNIVGAASLGWRLRSAGDAADFAARHSGAVSAFTAATLVLQGFAMAWIVTRVLGGTAGLVATAAVATAMVLGRRLESGLPSLAPVVWLFSATVAFLVAGDARTPEMAGVEVGWLGLAGLAGICSLGFLLCPYLDASLLAARQAAGTRGRFTFGVGFSVLFTSMILVTLAYATTLPALMNGADFGAIGLFIGLHLIVQVAFTNVAHLTSLRRLADFVKRPNLASSSLIAAGVMAGVTGWAVAVEVPLLDASGNQSGWSLDAVRLFDYRPGEVGYRTLLVFYGLVFPAYLLLGSRRMWIAVLLALPPIAVAFLGGEMAWSIAVVAIVMILYLIDRRRSRGRPRPLDAR